MNHLVYKLLALLILALSLAACGLFETAMPEDELIENTPVPDGLIAIQGTVVDNNIGVPADGNNVLTIELDDGTTRTVLYMEGGLVMPEQAALQCNSNDTVNQLAMTLSVGDIVRVVGAAHETYDIEVCNSEDYTIVRMNTAGNTTSAPIQPIDTGGPAPIEPIIIDPPSDAGTSTDGDILTVSVSGTVTGTIDECVVDGICAFIVGTETGTEITVIWSEGDTPNCSNVSLAGLDVQIGDSIEAFGRSVDDTTISICGDDSYSIREVS